MARPKPKGDLSTRTLEDLGLTENEAVLYILMLSRPPSTVRELGTLSPFPRTLLYHVLGLLEKRGLVTARKDGWRTVYLAADPEVLYDLLAHQEREAHRQREAALRLVPQLKHHYLLAGQRPAVRMFEGVAEFEKALDDALVSGAKEICAFENLGSRTPALETRATHERRRALRKVQKNILFFENKESLARLAARSYDDYTTYRSVHAGSCAPFESELLIYSGKVLYITSYGPHEPIAIMIEDKALYTMQKHFFDSLWAAGKDRTLYYTEVR